MIAPGGQPRLVIRRGHPQSHRPRRGQLEAAAPMRRWCSLGERLRDDRPTAGCRSSRGARKVAADQLARRDRLVRRRRRRKHPHSPLLVVEQPAEQRFDRRYTPGVRLSGATSMRGKRAWWRASCLRRAGSPTVGSSCSARGPTGRVPRCRLLCAPWIATLPNTAIAPVAAIASARARLARERSSITARYGETPERNCRILSNAAHQPA